VRLPSLIAWLSLAALPGFLAGCGGGAEGGPSGGARWRVAVIPKGTSHEFWKAVETGARRADAELADLEIVWKGPAGEGNTAEQQKVVENFLADGYDGICLAPLDGLALGKQVLRATGSGVPVVIFDSGLKDPAAAASIASYVATNNRAGGALAARTLVEPW
jgi:ribose transport system substrate-binding protein